MQAIVLSSYCWSTLFSCSPFLRDLCNLTFQHNLIQLADFPTHSSGNIVGPTLYILLTRHSHKSLGQMHSHFSLLRPQFNTFILSIQEGWLWGNVIIHYGLWPRKLPLSTDIKFLWNCLKDLILQLSSSHLYLYSYNSAETQVRSSVVQFKNHHQLHKIHSLRRKYEQPLTLSQNQLSSQCRISTASRYLISQDKLRVQSGWQIRDIQGSQHLQVHQ